MGIAKKRDGRLVPVSVNLPPEVYEMIKEAAEELGHSQSTLCAILIQDALESPRTKVCMAIAKQVVKTRKAAKDLIQAYRGFCERAGFLDEQEKLF